MEQSIKRYGSVLLTGLMLLASVRTGLFFDSDLYLIGTGFGILLLPMMGEWIYRGLQRPLQHGGMSGRLRIDPHFMVLIGCIGGMIMIYLQHGIRGPLSVEGTMKEIIHWGMYGCFAAAAWSICRTAGGLKAMKIGWHMLGALLCASALLAVYGVLELPYGIYRTADAEISATGARLGGLLQYPNTFGAVMAAFLLERLFALPPVLRTRTGMLRTAAALLPLLPYTAALLLTESRGAWLAAALACAAGLAMERRAITPLLTAAAAPMASAALLYRQLAEAQLAPAVLPGLLWLAGLWAGGVLAGLLLCRWRHSGSPRRRYAAPGGLVAAALLAAAAGMAILLQVQDRALGGAATLSARRLMYSDAWQLAKSSLWLGRGGETWRQSYLAIQSQPYVGGEVHSGYFDVLLNTGLVGLGLVLVLLIHMVMGIQRRCPRLAPPLLVLFGHAAVDFDWSYGLVWLLMFWLAAMGLAAASAEPWITPGEIDTSFMTPQHRRIHWPSTNRMKGLAVSRHMGTACNGAEQHVSSLVNPHAHPHNLAGIMRLTMLRKWGAIFSCSGLLGLTIILSLICWTLLAAALGISEFQARLATSAPQEQRIPLLQSSLKWNPANTAAAVSLSELLPPSRRIPLLKDSMVYAPEHPGLSWKLAEAYALTGQSEEAAARYAAGVDLDRFNAGKQTRSVLKLASLADGHRAAGELARSVRIAETAMDLLHNYRNLAADLNDRTGLRNDRGFHLSVRAKRQEGRLKAVIRQGEGAQQQLMQLYLWRQRLPILHGFTHPSSWKHRFLAPGFIQSQPWRQQIPIRSDVHVSVPHVGLSHFFR